MEFLPKGLHDQGGKAMRERLQAAVDGTDPQKHDAVALAYGLCNNGLVGLEARSLPLVLLRAHDCITAFLGSRERYAKQFREKPGTYFETTGWLERGADGGPYGLPTQTGGLGYDLVVLIEKYGEDNARYILETMTHHYRRLAFIRMGVEPDGSFEERTRALAAERGGVRGARRRHVAPPAPRRRPLGGRRLPRPSAGPARGHDPRARGDRQRERRSRGPPLRRSNRARARSRTEGLAAT